MRDHSRCGLLLGQWLDSVWCYMRSYDRRRCLLFDDQRSDRFNRCSARRQNMRSCLRASRLRRRSKSWNKSPDQSARSIHHHARIRLGSEEKRSGPSLPREWKEVCHRDADAIPKPTTFGGGHSMSSQEFILKLSAEARAWAHMILPILTAGVMGWHLPTPPWMNKKVSSGDKP